jgi:hypothetical protein
MSKHHHIGLLTTGQGFCESANQINNAPQMTAALLPVYYLYLHAVELALKSYIYFINQDENELKLIGHNLEAALDRALEIGITDIFPLSQELHKCIQMINPVYKGKELEYFYPGLKRLPAIELVNNSTNSLLQALEDHYRAELKNKT